MSDKLLFDTQIYTNLQSLDELKVKASVDKNKAVKEVAQQFEAIMLQMVVKSMRDANKALTNDEDSSQQMDMYQDLFDKQLTLVLGSHGNGFASIIEKNLKDHHYLNDPAVNPVPVAAKSQSIIGKVAQTAESFVHELKEIIEKIDKIS